MIQPQQASTDHYFRIDTEGKWFHNGDPINRAALAKLFADKGLKRDEEGKYWMQSPYEKYPVEVEDVPFIITDYKMQNNTIVLTTNMDEEIKVGEEHPLELRSYAHAEQKIPYIHVRDGLDARISRSVYYDLVMTYGETVESNGITFKLGESDDA